MIQQFEDIISWQKAQDLGFHIYALFKDLRDFAFKDQIRRAALSISNNIAEGFERKTNKEFKYFLYVAKGSCGEFRSMVSFAKRIGYLGDEEYEYLRSMSIEISKLISGLIKTL